MSIVSASISGKKYEDLSRRLEDLYVWAEDPRKLVPTPHVKRGMNPLVINQLMNDGYDIVINLVEEYHREIFNGGTELERIHPQKKVEVAAVKCLEDCVRRHEDAVIRAIKIGIMDRVQIDSLLTVEEKPFADRIRKILEEPEDL